MLAKLVITLLAALAIAATVLELRHARLQVMHEMAELHMQIDKVRRETWDLQVRVADKAAPEAVKAATQRQQIALEPQVIRYPADDIAVARAGTEAEVRP